jgi:ubiquinone/menaquinone biosynthesis C-methylase UbiE
MKPIIHFAYGRETQNIMKFKDEFPFLNDDEIAEYYERIKDVPINTSRLTDLNTKCMKYILKNIIGENVLDAACGRGYLLSKIQSAYPDIKCTGTDLVKPLIPPNFEMIAADITSLPFSDKSFDTVLCTHALEHIKDHHAALAELKRVTKHRLIIVVPCQREYKYTVDLHINFFPYMHTFKRFIACPNARYLKLGSDLLCCADR